MVLSSVIAQGLSSDPKILDQKTNPDNYDDMVLSSVIAQGLSSDPIFLVENLSDIAPGKHQEVKKLLAKNIEKRMPIEKVWSAQNESEALNLLRHIGNQRRREMKHRDR